ncbi:MAG: hypothetical protein OXE96_12690 [Gemmatimonadetes bacterium]|nr:hypothetical protein [Gemmatimonadota bacterium]
MEQTFEPSAEVSDFGVSISLDKIGIRIKSPHGFPAETLHPVTSDVVAVQLNPEVTVWSVEQARQLVFHLRRAIDALANPT